MVPSGSPSRASRSDVTPRAGTLRDTGADLGSTGPETPASNEGTTTVLRGKVNAGVDDGRDGLETAGRTVAAEGVAADAVLSSGETTFAELFDAGDGCVDRVVGEPEDVWVGDVTVRAERAALAVASAAGCGGPPRAPATPSTISATPTTARSNAPALVEATRALDGG
jgi:hypothetical protein